MLSNTNVEKKRASNFRMDGERLAQKRFRLLMQQLERNGSRGWQRELADKIGVSRGMVSAIWLGEKEAGLKAIGGAIQRMGIDRAFFFDASLGESPDHSKFIGSHAVQSESRIERDATDESSFSTWDRFLLSDEAARATKEALAHARSRRNDGGGVTVSALIEIVRAFDAGRKLRLIEEPEIVTGVRRGRVRSK